MFQVNDVIVYGTQGVCRIVGTEEKVMSGVKRCYYILKPVNDKGATIYAPTDNAHVLAKMRKLLTVEQIHGLIDSMPEETTPWIENESERKELYKQILSRGDHLELIRMIKAIYAQKKEREAMGKHLRMTDERFFKDAEQILYDEFQYVLELQGKEDLLSYIIARVERPEDCKEK